MNRECKQLSQNIFHAFIEIYALARTYPQSVPRLSAAIPPIAERSAPHSDPPHYKLYNEYVSGPSIMESLEILTILWSRRVEAW